MRKFITGIIFVLLFLAACSSEVQTKLADDPVVELYGAMSGGDLEFTEMRFAGKEAEDMRELISSECPNDVGEAFTRLTIRGRGSSMVAYTSPDGETVFCSLFKSNKDTVSYISPDDAPEGVVLVVNGVEISGETVQARINTLPETVPRDTNALGQILNAMVNDELLRQESESITVTIDELLEERAKFLTQQGLTEETLATLMADQNISEEDFDASLESQARLQKLLDERLLLDNIEVSDDAAKEYYIQNPNQFLQAERAVMRHILVASEGRSPEEAAQRAQTIMSSLPTNDFCDLVKTYSDDSQNKESCGVYVLSRGVIDANLEYASFNTPLNQTALVQTEIGIHLVQTLQVIPAQVVSYNQVGQNLQTSLLNSVFQQRLAMYQSILRGDSEIIVYLNK